MARRIGYVLLAIVGVFVAGLVGLLVFVSTVGNTAAKQSQRASIGIEPRISLRGNGYCNLHQPYAVSTRNAIPAKVWVGKPVRIDIMVDNHGPTMPLLAVDPLVATNLTVRPITPARIMHGANGPIYVYSSPSCGHAVRLGFTITAQHAGHAGLIYFLYPRLIHGDDQGEIPLVQQGRRRMMAIRPRAP